MEVKKMKVVIIGGVAGAKLRGTLRGWNDRIILLERGEHISYANCVCPTMWRLNRAVRYGDARRHEQQFNIDVRVYNEAIAIDRKQKQSR